MSGGRYVVLHHTGYGEPHFDLMLAVDDTGPLLTWRCPAWPPTRPEACVPLPPHRRVYLDYEGPVSGNRGQVRRVATGVYALADADERSMTIIVGELTYFLRKAGA